MKKIRLTEMSEAERRLLTDAEQSGGLVVEDDRGQTRSRLYAYREPTEVQRQAAWEGMKDFQKNVQQSFDEQALTEDDLDRLLQEDE